MSILNQPHLGAQALRVPEKAAIIMASTGRVVTYRALNERSNRLAQALASFGLRPGDNIALWLENNERFHEVCWAAQRSGLYFTAINSHLTPREAAYIVNDCGAKVLVTSQAMGRAAEELLPLIPGVKRRFLIENVPGGQSEIGTRIGGYELYDELLAQFPAEKLEKEMEGGSMLYSSGTTGQPKGVKRALALLPMGTAPNSLLAVQENKMGFDEDSVYLSPAPLYHAAPLAFTMNVLRLGGTVVVMERFEALETLRLIEHYRVTCGQFVPTMFSRLLKLPEKERSAFDLSSLKSVIHAAAPCPVEVKRQMIQWWGQVINEYYAATEGNGMTFINSVEWLAHPGSVGRPLVGEVHILDEAGQELPPEQPGIIWFSGTPAFEYHNDPAKTASSFNEKGWSTLWDIGFLDQAGFLYLTDRKSYMIVSGGVNIYPQEIENVLVLHPAVFDVAVFGVPNEEFGEEIKAVVQPASMAESGPELEQELLQFCRARLAGFKCPRSIDFEPELPRSPTGKLYKRLLRDRYWGSSQSKIV